MSFWQSHETGKDRPTWSSLSQLRNLFALQGPALQVASGQQESERNDQRKQTRYSTEWPAHCTNEQGHSWSTSVVDTSIGGLGLKSCPDLHIDDVICVELTDIGQFDCRVAWVHNNRCGVQFVNKLEDEHVRAMCDVVDQLSA